MRLDQIMVPREQAVTAAVGDTIQDVLQSMVAKRVGCVVITEGDKAVGIVTNTDMTKAYVNGVPKSTAVSEIMSKQLVTALGTLARDNATALFEKHKIHHVIVTDESKAFLGIITSWDIAREVALDQKAWPWNRDSEMFLGAAKKK